MTPSNGAHPTKACSSLNAERGKRILQAGGRHRDRFERKLFLSAYQSDLFNRVLAKRLEAEGAIKKWRDLMGATNPAQAAEGTLRREFGDSLEANATHGSDAPETAAFEIGYFFSGLELLV